ncbi:hypothetical protein ACFLU4_07645 [Chloroflexota bacterium]
MVRATRAAGFSGLYCSGWLRAAVGECGISGISTIFTLITFGTFGIFSAIGIFDAAGSVGIFVHTG